MEDSDELYEELIDSLINNQPLTSSRINEFDDAMRVNQQLVNNMYSIRRYLEIADENEDEIIQEEPYNNINNLLNNLFNNVNVDISVSNINDYSRQTLPLLDINPQFNLQNLFTNDNSNNTMLNRLMSMFLEGRTTVNESDFEDVKVTLTENEFDKLNVLSLSHENIKDYSNKECNICMDEYVVNEKIVELDCKHVFHESCIRNWLCNEKISCPVCRKDTREMIKDN